MFIDQEERNKIIKLVYQFDEWHHYTGGYCTFTDFEVDYPDLALTLAIYHQRFLRLLWSRYNGLRYKPERFDKIVFDND